MQISGSSQNLSFLASLDKIIYSNLPVICKVGLLSSSGEQNWGLLWPQPVGRNGWKFLFIEHLLCVGHYIRDVNTKNKNHGPCP